MECFPLDNVNDLPVFTYLLSNYDLEDAGTDEINFTKHDRPYKLVFTYAENHSVNKNFNSAFYDAYFFKILFYKEYNLQKHWDLFTVKGSYNFVDFAATDDIIDLVSKSKEIFAIN